jgi:predicted acyl esterase
MTVVPNVPITMDDKVILFATIGYPTDLATGQRAAGNFPVLLAQNPYLGPKQQPAQPDAFFVTRGYIFALVTVRGTLNSKAPGGAPLINDMFSPREAQDGVELVNWAAHVDGSNGVVGLTGCSQLGDLELFTAAAVGPHSPVKAILPACAGSTYDGVYFSGGMPGPIIGLFSSPSAGLSGPEHAKENDDFNRAFQAEVLAGGQRAYDNLYWQQRTTTPALAAQIVRNGIPALLWTGWNAPDNIGSLAMYAAFQNAWLGRPFSAPMSTHQPTTGRYQIIVGPWGHGQGLDENIELEWYDTWLKGQHTDMTDTRTPMHLFQNGSGSGSGWVNASTNPVASAYTPYDLSGGGALVASGRGGRTTSPDGSSSDTIVWGQPSQPGTTLSYTTPSFPRGATVAGPISATIYASSSNRNLELIGTLYDVAPDGTAAQIATGSLVGSMRAINPQQSWFDRHGVLIQPAHPFLADNYVPAGQTARYDITLYPAVWSLPAGDALRLTLSTQEPTSACASFLTALLPAIPCLPTAPQLATLPGGPGSSPPPAVYTIEHSRFLPSSVNLPLLPNDYLPVALSQTTPTSNGLTEPIGWSSHPPGGSEQ